MVALTSLTLVAVLESAPGLLALDGYQPVVTLRRAW